MLVRSSRGRGGGGVTINGCILFHSSANVLLDIAYRAKLGDFGLARAIVDPEIVKTSVKTKRIVGTSGYIPPEYYRGVISIRMDSFAFGVVS